MVVQPRGQGGTSEVGITTAHSNLKWSYNPLSGTLVFLLRRGGQTVESESDKSIGAKVVTTCNE